MTERHNVEIDYCPACRGVWLDKGELDKMLEYAAHNQPVEKRGESHDPGYYSQEKKYYGGHHKPYKRKSFLNDFFDFD